MVLSKDTECREIITSAVCGKGHQYVQSTYTITPANRPTTIGGCWVMNHTYAGTLVDDVVEIRGQFDINVWYSFNGNSETTVAKDSVSYFEKVPVHEMDPNCFKDEREIVVQIGEQPNCLDATITSDGESIAVRVEMNLAVEVMGRTKVWVVTCSTVEKKDDFESVSSFEDSESTH